MSEFLNKQWRRCQAWWKRSAPFRRRVRRVLGVAVLLLIAWIAFLAIAKEPPIETVPAMVMTWASAAVLLVAAFPEVFDRIQSFKLKDFEVVFRNAVADARVESYVLLSEDNALFTVKDDFQSLAHILNRTIRDPQKTVLLVVNLKTEMSISVSMLFVYLEFLNLFGSSVVVLFVSSRRGIARISQIPTDSVIGAVSGKTAIQVLLREFPFLAHMFDQILSGSELSQTRFILRTRIDSDAFARYASKLRAAAMGYSEGSPDNLTVDDVRQFFHATLSTCVSSMATPENHIASLKEAIAEKHEFIVIERSNNYVYSVVPVCRISGDFVLRALPVK